MKIAEAAAETGLSADTIRYYDRIGLMPELGRGGDGHRVFTAKDLRWLRMFERLRATGMPLANVRRYYALAQAGDKTISQRRAMLETHQLQLDKRQAEIDACRALIDEKLANYRKLDPDKT